MTALFQSLRELPLLCQGRPDALKDWLDHPTAARLIACVTAIVLGCGAYGFTLGLWRAPLMGGFVAAKLPLLIFLTLLTNGLLNGMLSQLLGSGLGFRQTMLAMLMSFACFSLITGALSPVALLMVLNAPPPDPAAGRDAYRIILLVHVSIIAFAGITAHRRFYPVLAAAADNPAAAPRVFLTWLAGNLFVGAQLSWNLRPFFGQPAKEVSFLRADWNKSSFYESIYYNLKALLGPLRHAPVPVILLLVVCAAIAAVCVERRLRLKRLRY